MSELTDRLEFELSAAEVMLSITTSAAEAARLAVAEAEQQQAAAVAALVNALRVDNARLRGEPDA